MKGERMEMIKKWYKAESSAHYFIKAIIVVGTQRQCHRRLTMATASLSSLSRRSVRPSSVAKFDVCFAVKVWENWILKMCSAALFVARAPEQPAVEDGGEDGNWQKVSRR